MATSRHPAARNQLPLFPQQATFRGPCGTSVRDPKQPKFGAVERKGDCQFDSMRRLCEHGIPMSTPKEQEET